MVRQKKTTYQQTLWKKTTHPFSSYVLLILYQRAHINRHKLLHFLNCSVHLLLSLGRDVQIQRWVFLGRFRTIRVPNTFRRQRCACLIVNLDTPNDKKEERNEKKGFSAKFEKRETNNPILNHTYLRLRRSLGQQIPIPHIININIMRELSIMWISRA